MEHSIDGGRIGAVLKNKYFWYTVGGVIVLGLIVLFVYLTSYELWGNRLECEKWGGAYFVSWVIFLTGLAVGSGLLYKYMSKNCDSKLKSKELEIETLKKK